MQQTPVRLLLLSAPALQDQVYIDFTLHANSRRLYLFGKLKKQGIIWVSSKYSGRNDI